MASTTRRTALAAALAITALAATGHTMAQDGSNWPTKPIKLTVPYTPGGSTDIVSRTVFEAVGKRLGQPVVIENKPGANSTIPRLMATTLSASWLPIP